MIKFQKLSKGINIGISLCLVQSLIFRIDLLKLGTICVSSNIVVLLMMLGSTPNSEDIARSIPNMNIISPCDPLELRQLSEWPNDK